VIVIACAWHLPKDIRGAPVRQFSSRGSAGRTIAVKDGSTAAHPRRARPTQQLWADKPYRRVITSGKTRMLVLVKATGMAVQKQVTRPAAIPHCRRTGNLMSSESSHFRSPRAIPNKLPLIEESILSELYHIYYGCQALVVRKYLSSAVTYLPRSVGVS